MTQAEALSILKTGASVFLTGEPGSGKTHTVNEYVKYLQSGAVNYALTASTGIAATHIGGSTIHSWSGIGIKNSLTKSELSLIAQNSRVAGRIKKAKVLIIDEISMLSAETFTLVEKVCRVLRASTLPFGGLQVVLVGDFFQLPPIPRRSPENNGEQLSLTDETSTSLFAFGAPAWGQLDPVVCYLSEQHRQEDPVFLAALTAIRRNQVSVEVRACFTSRINTAVPLSDVTKLFPHNTDVDRLNDLALAKLPTATKSFTMYARGAPPLIESLKRSCLSPETLNLKVGAKVMLTKNNPEGKYVNGTTGEVVGYSDEDGWPIVRTRAGRRIIVTPTEWAITDGDRVLAAISQVPLRLAWAITVHKSQGMSLDAAIIDLRSAFEYGQGYVALSRVRTLDGLHLLGFNDRALEVHPEVLDQDSRFRQRSVAVERQYSGYEPTKLAKLQADFLAEVGGGFNASAKTKSPKVSTYQTTKELLTGENLSVDTIAKKRGMTAGTIIGHLEALTESGEIIPTDHLAKLKPDSDRFLTIKTALLAVKEQEGKMLLSQTRERLGPGYSFDEIRLVRLFL